MAVAFVGSETNSANSADSIIVDVHGSVIDGHVGLAFYSWSDNDGIPLTMTGWTQIDEHESAASTHGIWRRVASSEPGDYTMSGDSSGTKNITGVIAWWSGVDTTTPLDVVFVHDDAYKRDVNSQTPTPQPITTATDGAVVVLYSVTNNNNISDVAPPTNYTERADIDDGTWRHVELCDRTIVSATTETPGAFLHADIDATDDTIMYTLALRPASDVGLPSFRASNRGIMRGIARGVG